MTQQTRRRFLKDSTVLGALAVIDLAGGKTASCPSCEPPLNIENLDCDWNGVLRQKRNPRKRPRLNR
jgi:hypothetical protein